MRRLYAQDGRSTSSKITTTAQAEAFRRPEAPCSWRQDQLSTDHARQQRRRRHHLQSLPLFLNRLAVYGTYAVCTDPSLLTICEPSPDNNHYEKGSSSALITNQELLRCLARDSTGGWRSMPVVSAFNSPSKRNTSSVYPMYRAQPGVLPLPLVVRTPDIFTAIRSDPPSLGRCMGPTKRFN